MPATDNRADCVGRGLLSPVTATAAAVADASFPRGRSHVTPREEEEEEEEKKKKKKKKGPRDVFSSTGVPPTDKRQPPTANRLPKIVSTQKRAWRFVDCIAPSMERRLPQHSSRHDGRVGAQIPDDFATDSTRWIRRRSPPPTGTAPATVLHLSEETASPYRRLQLLIAAGKAPLPSQEREVEGGKDSPATRISYDGGRLICPSGPGPLPLLVIILLMLMLMLMLMALHLGPSPRHRLSRRPVATTSMRLLRAAPRHGIAMARPGNSALPRGNLRVARSNETIDPSIHLRTPITSAVADMAPAPAPAPHSCAAPEHGRDEGVQSAWRELPLAMHPVHLKSRRVAVARWPLEHCGLDYRQSRTDRVCLSISSRFSGLVQQDSSQGANPSQASRDPGRSKERQTQWLTRLPLETNISRTDPAIARAGDADVHAELGERETSRRSAGRRDPWGKDGYFCPDVSAGTKCTSARQETGRVGQLGAGRVCEKRLFSLEQT
ncbi:unnamed protein product [Diplocarpon coronariae]